ncbi:NAD(P)-dependent oxidoreductase [Agrococcus casei]|uniref:3-hydroxyisobutyrate dehydrogenase n=2 Tax=Agrococcus TaxID=46352 RepID=A0A1R4GF16_9MICO|nr:NAD(P)-dependent oxidoreductase [Agrococcus casei]SJM66760.1 3-hydroxyisobutyrate dehydrogenase [Agrococcus casei LMG 22410]
MNATIFIGLGHMGAPMARLHSAAHPTFVFDVVPAASEGLAADSEATAIASLEAIPADVDTVILMLPTSRHVEQLLVDDGLFERLPKGAVVIDMGSSEPQSTQQLAKTAGEHGLGYVDAPVSGGVAKAETGELAIIVGGAADHVAHAMPHLEVLGGDISHVGDAGAGHAVKALNNLLSATNIAAASEAATIGAKFGVAPDVFIDVINTATGMSQASQVKFPKHILPGTFASGFAYDLMLKDMKIAMGLAEQVGFSPVTTAAFETLSEGREALGERPDHTEVARVYEQRTGIELRASEHGGEEAR